jgi:hypothetical protein
MNEKPKTGLGRPSSVSNLRAAAASPAPLAATVPTTPTDAPGHRAKEWPIRIPLNVDDGMRRALEQARVDDRIETTARIRAMITLWQQDEQFRDRVNELAPSFRPGGRPPRP